MTATLVYTVLLALILLGKKAYHYNRVNKY